MRKSFLYSGTLRHHRFSPVDHDFTYRVFYFYLDLDEVKSIFRLPFILSYNFPGLISFWRKDYLGDKKRDLKSEVKRIVKEKAGVELQGPIRLLTNVSYLGHCFNPVSFYYCFKENGEDLDYIVAEVTNTPWGEKYQHVVKAQGKTKEHFTMKKDFHVSPFMPMGIDYTWVLNTPGDELSIYMQNRLSGEKDLLFDSDLKLNRHVLNKKNLVRHFLLYPLMTYQTVAGIYFEALRLYIKRVPFFTHPDKIQTNGDKHAE